MTEERPPAGLPRRLRHADPETRRRARQEVAEALEARGGDVGATARALGLSPTTVRKWRHGAQSRELDGRRSLRRRQEKAPGPAAPPSTAVPGAHSPFDDFGSQHLTPLSPEPSATSPPPRPAPGSRGDNPVPTSDFEGAAEAAPATPRPHAPPAAGPLFHQWISSQETARPRRVAFVLHAHMPWVLGHGTWPHGEEWLAEAVAHCYVPLLSMLRRLREEGRRRLLTLSVTPVLACQLADPRAKALVDRYLEQRLSAAEALGEHHLLASWWHRELDETRQAWQEMDRDVVATLAALEEDGVVELSTAAATHPYLPLLHRLEHARLQVASAYRCHQELFGRPPRGLWMPECAYRGAGPWHHPATGALEPFRPGNEELLEEQGIRWTVLDAHQVLGSEPLTGYGFQWAGDAPVPQGPEAIGGMEGQVGPLARHLQPAWIGASRVAAMVREPYTARQVWSRHVGYPGDPRYLDFHKRHASSGFRLWRVTDTEADLADKLPYWPADATEALRAQARHFVDLVQAIPGLEGGVAICPFDAELFGHWWFEGPAWLEEVLRRCDGRSGPRTVTPESELAERPPRRRCDLTEGSWGEGGGHEVWLHPDTEGMWRDLRQAEDRVATVLARGDRSPEAAVAILVQLMLLAASDWPFLVSRGTAADYARGRFEEHRRRLQVLLDLGTNDPLPSWAGDDLPNLPIDPRWWSAIGATDPKRSKP